MDPMETYIVHFSALRPFRRDTSHQHSARNASTDISTRAEDQAKIIQSFELKSILDFFLFPLFLLLEGK
jgi:hypothetical protein